MAISHPPTSPEENPSPKKPSVLLYLLMGLVVLFLLQKIGCGPMRTEEKMEWLPR